MSPTSSAGGLDDPDYATAWDKAACVNTRPMPSGRPVYPTMLACCKGAYGGQMSGYCLSKVTPSPTPSPTLSPQPTLSPTPPPTSHSFTTNSELRTAIQEYLAKDAQLTWIAKPVPTIAAQWVAYGALPYSINTFDYLTFLFTIQIRDWDVSRVEDF